MELVYIYIFVYSNWMQKVKLLISGTSRLTNSRYGRSLIDRSMQKINKMIMCNILYILYII